MRTNLIISMQESRARGFAVWRSQQDADILRVWPAQELYRAYTRNQPRKWRKRWNTARAGLGPGNTSATYATGPGGPFIALKSDQIWAAISRFGSPHPPFDYQSGMRLRNIDAASARAAKVLRPGQPPPAPRRDPMRQVQSSSTAGMAPEVIRAWAAAFGERAKVYGGRIAVAPDRTVIGEILEVAESGAKASAPFGMVPDPALAAAGKALGAGPLAPETAYSISADSVRHIYNSHAKELRRNHRSVTSSDIEALPDTLAANGLWRVATEQEKGGKNIEALTFIASTGERIGFTVSRHKRKPRLDVKTMYIQTR